MKTKLLVMMLAGSSLFAETHISIGIGSGTPGYYPPPVVAYAPSPCPFLATRGPRAAGILAARATTGCAGCWALPPYADGCWVAPCYYEHRYFAGYWEHRKRHWEHVVGTGTHDHEDR